MIRLRLSLILVFFTVLAVGCESADPPAPTFTVRDSAGIEIVESSAPLLGPDAWTISEEPVLQIGEVEGEAGYLFGRIVGAIRLDEGGIVVCDRFDDSVRFFDQVGVFQRQVGGTGEGPGKFNRISSCDRWKDQIVVAVNGRPQFLSRDGVYLRSGPLPIAGDRPSPILGVLADGSFVLSVFQMAPRRPGLNESRTGFTVIDSVGEVKSSLRGLPQSIIQSGDGWIGIQAFSGGAQAVAGDELFYYGWPQTYEVRAFDGDLVLKRLIRIEWQAPPVTEEDREFWRRARIESRTELDREPSPERLRTLRVHAEEMVFPEHHAAFDALALDLEGFLWARYPNPRYNPRSISVPNLVSPFDTTWDVIDSSGRWVTTLTLPARFRIEEIGSDYIVGVWKDELEIEYVRMYSLDRGG